ncbi:MAG: hypothetical protein IT303_06845 [Dehalococcoidia bacterium]|nr:hypothetical protein [Dehalococcoidia bacterium]
MTTWYAPMAAGYSDIEPAKEGAFTAPGRPAAAILSHTSVRATRPLC